MHPLLLPGLLVSSAMGALLLGKKEEAAPVSADALIATTQTPDGATVASFKLEAVPAIMQALGSFALFNGMEVPGTTTLVYEIGPPEGARSAAQDALAAQAGGYYVVASDAAIAAGVQGGDTGVLIFCEPKAIAALAKPGNKCAILLSPSVQREAVTPRSSTPQADPAMPANVLARVQEMLANEAPDTAALRKSAVHLEGRAYPVAAKALRDRADAVDLERALVAEMGGSVGAEPEAPEADVDRGAPNEEAPTVAAEEAPGDVAEAVPEAHHSALNGASKIHAEAPTQAPEAAQA